MARSRDRTEDFRDTVRSVALSLEYDESKMAAILASMIMHKPLQRSPFTKAALKTLGSIEELERFIVKHRKDYVDLHRTTEQERDNIEHEVSVFIKACKDQIDILKNTINDVDKSGSSRTWLVMREGNSNADIIAHRHGVVLILSERLHSVTAQFDQLRAIRFQDAVTRAIPRRKMHRLSDSDSSDASKSNNSVLREQEVLPEPLRLQQQLLDDETRALQVELSSLLDAVQETETKMVEMSALNHLMATHVLQQAQQIEHLYEQVTYLLCWQWKLQRMLRVEIRSCRKPYNATAAAGLFFCSSFLSSPFPSFFWTGIIESESISSLNCYGFHFLSSSGFKEWEIQIAGNSGTPYILRTVWDIRFSS